MKVLVLIISSDTCPVYAQHRKIWSSYMNTNPDVSCYFIQYRNGPIKIENNTLWLPGVESFKNIITKTLDSIEYFLNKDKYDFIVRTNMSSFWNFNALLKFLETIPNKNIYSGIVTQYGNISYASGAGFIITTDIAKLLLESRAVAESVKIIDDVDIGYTMAKLNIPIYPARRINFLSRSDYLNYKINYDDYHYRIKIDSSRNDEIPIMNDLYQLIYKRDDDLNS